MIEREREEESKRESERERDIEKDAEQSDARNIIKNRYYKTLILKLVNLLESLEDRIVIHI